MIDPKQFDETKEETLLNTVLVFNQLYKEMPTTITDLSYYELYDKAKKEHEIPLLDWKMFYTDRRVQAWYAQELELTINSRLQKLAKQAGTDKSTATQQTLTALLKHVGDSSGAPEDNKIFVVQFIPLTNVEEHIENVKIIDNIPKEIADAITIYEGTNQKKS